MEISNLTRQRIKEFLDKGKRFDERELLNFRKLEIETEISKNAEGSCKIKMGDTEVIAGVKIDVAEPYTDSEEEGNLITTCELLPLSSPKFELGPPGIEAIEIARIVDRSIRNSGIVDFKKLCIKKGEKVYVMLVDIYPLNEDGNLIDAACLASAIAIRTAKMPKYDEKKEKVKYGDLTSKSLPLTGKMPITITFHKIGNSILIDPVREEEESSEARLTITLTEGKEILINAIQKGGEKTFSQEEIEKIIDLATEKFKELSEKVEKSIK